jgi:hypothetical protein
MSFAGLGSLFSLEFAPAHLSRDLLMVFRPALFISVLDRRNHQAVHLAGQGSVRKRNPRSRAQPPAMLVVSGPRASSWCQDAFVRFLSFVESGADRLLSGHSLGRLTPGHPGIIAFARKIAAENRDKMKQRAIVGIKSSRNHQRNGSVHILDTADVEDQRVVDFEVVQKANAPGRVHDQRSRD